MGVPHRLRDLRVPHPFHDGSGLDTGQDDLPLLAYEIMPVELHDGTIRTARLAWLEELDMPLCEFLESFAIQELGTSIAAKERAWLLQFLRSNGGRSSVADVQEAAKAAGFTDERRMRRAKQAIEAVTESEGFSAIKYWSLPD